MSAQTWWGEFEVPLGAVRRWQIGPLCLWVERRANEWRVARAWGSDPFADGVEVAVDPDTPEGGRELEGLDWRRFLFTDTSGSLKLMPRVADRPVVSRPEQPLVLPAGETAVLFMASPVWVALAVGEVSFFEVPIWRLSATWFGENTLEGALCYATRSRARLEVGQSHGPRITTSVSIRNSHASALQVERLALPLPQLGVFADEAGGLWTEATSVAYDPDKRAPAKIEGAPPEVAGRCTQLSGPREDRQSHVLARAISAAIRGVMS